MFYEMWDVFRANDIAINVNKKVKTVPYVICDTGNMALWDLRKLTTAYICS